MSFDAAYEALTDHDDDTRWAYGTGFADPLAGVATTIPGDVDPADLAAYCLMLGDDALVLSHRLQQWVTRAPELEDELAIANIALDLLGQARLLLSRAGEVEGAGRDEDDLAYLRDPGDFRNVRLAERTDDDFAHLIARLLVFATWRLALLDRLAASRDPVLAAIGAKGVKELTYHREYAAQWAVRLGDGTDLSRDRIGAALDAVEPLTGELFHPHEIELRLAAAGVAVDSSTLHAEFDAVLTEVRRAATLPPAGGSTADTDLTEVGIGGSTPGTDVTSVGVGGFPADTGVTFVGVGGFPADTGVTFVGVGGFPADTGVTFVGVGGFPADTGVTSVGVGGFPADTGVTSVGVGGFPADTGVTSVGVGGFPAGAGVTTAEGGSFADGDGRDGASGAAGSGRASGAAGSGRDGVHGPALTELLGEMQGLARELPGGVW